VEQNPFLKRWRRGLKRVALVYPNAYIGGIANIGLQYIYAYVNSLEGFICERFYADVFDGLRSLESGTPLKDFDIALFSIQFEEDMFKAVEILEKSGFKGLKVAGGPCIMINPKPMKAFFDVFVVGEVENSGVLDVVLDAKSREDLKGYESTGIWTGEGFVKRIRPKKLDFYLKGQILSETVFGRCVLLEIGRGCVRRCRFCVVRNIYSPPRWRDISLLLKTAEDFVGYVDKACLIAPSVLDHPKAVELIAKLVDLGYTVSPSSTRIDSLNEEVIELLVKGGLKSLTIAPETGERLRMVIRKDFNDDQIFDVVETAKEKGIRGLKLYFMVGLPTESDEDVKDIVNLVRSIRGLNVSVSINPFVPKPHTPFQWCRYDLDVKRRLNLLKKELSKVCDVKVESVERFAIQTILSRGEEDVSRLLKLKPNLKLAKRLNLTRYLDEIPVDEELPWDFIDHGYKKKSLIQEYTRAITS
jgi:radical SAM superfamily enzyme YgiQ (UPF0313 family)